MELKGKTALVTGSSRGIGKAIAYKLASLGANVVINSSTKSSDCDITLNEMKNAGFNVMAYNCSVTQADEINDMVKKTIEVFGSLDILVNNAGVTKDTLLLRMSEEDWDKVIDINLKGAFLCTKAAIKYMSSKKNGKIINVSSVIGLMGNAGQANYAASKAGLIGFTKSIAKEYASRGITCNAIAPGFILSKMTDDLPQNLKELYLNTIPLKRFGTSEDVANLVAFLSSDYSNYITGQVINVDGGMVM